MKQVLTLHGTNQSLVPSQGYTSKILKINSRTISCTWSQMKQDKHLLAQFLCKGKHTSPLPVQYAAPWEKKKGISEPISLDHSWSSFSVATQPLNWFAAQRAVAALLLPPPSPAPLGTFLSRWICRQVLMRKVCRQCISWYNMNFLYKTCVQIKIAQSKFLPKRNCHSQSSSYKG